MEPFGRCRVCGSKDLTFLFSLGDQFLNNFVSPGHELHGETYPIELELCGKCTLVQLRHTAPQDFLYTRHYWYRSGVTDTMRAALRDVVDSALRVAALDTDDVFLDIGSNDGTLLREVPSNLYRVGVEPATNLSEEGSRDVHCFISDFWSAQAYFGRVEDHAKVVTALGMFYDLDDPNQFIADVATVLHPDGVFIAQLMCLRHMLDQQDVGNLTHEHLEFYSVESLEYLFKSHGLEIIDIENNDVNGGSYRVYCRHKGSRVQPKVGAEARIKDARAMEGWLDHPETYFKFFQQLEDNKRICREFIQSAHSSGKKFWVYGASTKGNVILQYYGLDKYFVEGAADRSPEKWGKVTIGTGIPICSEEDARKASPDYFIVLPYAFLSEFIQRERAWLQNGGIFFVPLPLPRLVSMKDGVVVETVL